MIKTIFKETCIILLLCIAIALVLGIVFYDYIPANKVIPTKEAYFTPNEVKEEIDEQISEVKKTEISYEITDADLNIYKQSSSYKPGKKDPFALSKSESPSSNPTGNNTTNNSANNSSSRNENTSNTSDVDKNSTGTFFNDTGIK